MTEDYEAEILRDENDELAETVHNLFQSLLEAEKTIEDLNKRLAEVAPKNGEWLNREVVHDRADAKITDWQQAKCSVCKRWHTTPYLYDFNDYKYCPVCGARMGGAE